MSRKLTLKKLKASDLSFFQTYLEKFPQAKQKGFNLDRKVIEDAFFPSLTAVLDGMAGKRAPVQLTIFGPGAVPPYQLMRKVLKQQKNWRLNGEAIHSPPGDLSRYDSLAPEDFAIMEFSGDSYPNAVKVVILSASNSMDAATRTAFAVRFPGDSMSILTEEDIQAVINVANTPQDHPIRDWLDRDLLEEVAQGDAAAADKLLKKRAGRGLSGSELKKAKDNAEKIGRWGEELLDFHFGEGGGGIAGHEWVADVNAIAPFDFALKLSDGSIRHLDAKSTGGPFNNPIHLSLGEIQHALSSGVPYDLCRLYNVSEDRAQYRVAKNIAGKLPPVAAALKGLPAGVKADSLSFNPNFFGFDPTETTIEYPDD
jgi:hypothetical protein